MAFRYHQAWKGSDIIKLSEKIIDQRSFVVEAWGEGFSPISVQCYTPGLLHSRVSHRCWELGAGEGTLQNLMGGLESIHGGSMGGAGVKRCWKVPVEEFIC